MTESLVLAIDRSDHGFVTVTTAPGYELLGHYLRSDLVGVSGGPFPVTYEAALEGLRGADEDQITGNCFTVRIQGPVTVLEDDYDEEITLTMATAAFKEALDAYGVWDSKGSWQPEPTPDGPA